MILGIETSCDETAVALVTQDGEVLANVVASQAELHARYGGVVPEVASRRHLELAAPVLTEALEQGKATLDDVEAGLARFRAAFGRFERIPSGDKAVLLLLIKNPAGANEVVRTLVADGGPRVAVVALNDNIADGRDVSWIWDVDFEPLAEGLERLVVTGGRAHELALRFKYGGVPPERIEVVADLERALDRGLELTPRGAELVVLPTYTAMLALRRIAVARGLARPYWEEAA